MILTTRHNKKLNPIHYHAKVWGQSGVYSARMQFKVNCSFKQRNLGALIGRDQRVDECSRFTLKGKCGFVDINTLHPKGSEDPHAGSETGGDCWAFRLCCTLCQSEFRSLFLHNKSQQGKSGTHCTLYSKRTTKILLMKGLSCGPCVQCSPELHIWKQQHSTNITIWKFGVSEIYLFEIVIIFNIILVTFDPFKCVIAE